MRRELLPLWVPFVLISVAAVSGFLIASAPNPALDPRVSMKNELVVTVFKHTQSFADLSMVSRGWQPDCWVGCKGVHYTIDPNPLTTNAGITFLVSKGQITAYANNGDYAQYIAVTSTAVSPAYTDTTLSGEITTNGLARAIAACSVNTAATGLITATCSKTFTASATFTAVQAAGLFTQSVTGILYEEGTFNSVNLISGDTLQVTWLSSYQG